MIAMVEELKLLDRRIRCAGRAAAAVGGREPPVDAFLLAVALENGILDALADDQGSGTRCARRYAAAVFFKFRDYPGLSGKNVL